MERPRDKGYRSPPMHAPHSSRPAQDYDQRLPYPPGIRSPFPSIPPGSRPRSPLVPRARPPPGPRPLSPSIPLSPSNTRHWSPLMPRARQGSRTRSPVLPRARSPNNPRPRSPALPRSRSPRDARPRSPYDERPRSPYIYRPRGPPPSHGHRPRSPHDPKYGGVRTHSPEGLRLHSHPPYRARSPHGARLRSPRSPGPLSRTSRQSPASRRRTPDDMRHRLVERHSSDHRGLSPLNLSEKAFAKQSLKITVGNDFFNRHSMERTKLYDALDNVSDDSREDFVDECILPRDFSLASMRSRSDEGLRLSPLNIKNDVDYRRDASCHPNSRISHDAHPRSLPENTAMPKMSSQPEQFKNSGFIMQQSSMKNTQDSSNQFSLTVDSYLKDFSKNDTSGTGYQNLGRPTEQDLYVLLSEGILADKRKRCKELGQQENSSVGKSGCQDASRMPHNLSLLNMSSIQGFPALEGKEQFPYGNACNLRNETHPSPSPLSALPSTQEQMNSEHSEFGKIQDLLKTIGLEIGAVEMGKLSARTRERLYGKELPLKVRERHSTDAQTQDAAKLRNRSYTRSPELDQKCSLSPAWSLRTSTDRLSHSKSEKEGTQELQGSQIVQEPPIAQEPSNMSLKQAPPNTSLEQEFQIAVLGRPPSYNSAALPSPATLTPTILAPHQMTNCSPYTLAPMLHNSANTTTPRAPFPPAFPPCSPVLPPFFVPNTSIPPPGFFPQYQMPGYTPYATSHVTRNDGIPTALPSNIYGSVMPPTKHDLPVNPVAQYKRIVPLHSNLKVIQTVDTPKSKETKPAKPKKPSSSHLVPLPKEDMLDKNNDKNRVAQKLKVLRDLEKLKSDQTVRGKKLAFLQKKLETLSAKHGEILQNKSQQNFFHTNPLLQQVRRIEKELQNLCVAAQKADEQKSSLEKVAKILGLNISEKPNLLDVNENKPTDDNLNVGRSTANSTTPIEVKKQTQVGNSTSS